MVYISLKMSKVIHSTKHKQKLLSEKNSSHDNSTYFQFKVKRPPEVEFLEKNHNQQSPEKTRSTYSQYLS